MKNKDITFHYTNEQMVKDLIDLIPIEKDDTFLQTAYSAGQKMVRKVLLFALHQAGKQFFNLEYPNI